MPATEQRRFKAQPDSVGGTWPLESLPELLESLFESPPVDEPPELSGGGGGGSKFPSKIGSEEGGGTVLPSDIPSGGCEGIRPASEGAGAFCGSVTRLGLVAGTEVNDSTAGAGADAAPRGAAEASGCRTAIWTGITVLQR